MKKFLFLFIVFAVMFSLVSFSAFAEDSIPDDITSEEPGDDAPLEEDENESANIFEVVYDELVRHADKLFSLLAFVGSLILAFAYRRGVLPLIKGGINALGGSVTKLKEETEKFGSESVETLKQASVRLGAAEDMLLSMHEDFSKIERKLSESIESQAKIADVRTIISSQVDMLYEIFMSSSLPLYQKEAVSEKINEMKRALGDSITEKE